MKSYTLVVMEGGRELDRVNLDSETGEMVYEMSKSSGQTNIPKNVRPPKISTKRMAQYSRTKGAIVRG